MGLKARHVAHGCQSILAGIVLFLLVQCTAQRRTGTPDERAALFDDIVRLTLDREAFAPEKLRDLNIRFESQAQELKQSFVEASTEADLLRALQRLSNLRKDGHLRVETVDGGLRYPDEPWKRAPLRLAVDFGNPSDYFLFVSDWDRNIAEHIVSTSSDRGPPEFGDRLRAVNAIPVHDYLRLMEPYIPYSTNSRLWLEFAVNASVRRIDFGPELCRSDVTYEFERKDATVYTVRLPYLDPQSIVWMGNASRRTFDGVPHEDSRTFTWVEWASQKAYPGFRAQLETDAFTLYVPTRDDVRVVLVDCHRFAKSLRHDVASLISFASEHKLLGYDVICDLTTCRGGQNSWFLLSHLVSRPFKATFGNLRISDVADEFTDRFGRIGPMREWLAGELPRAVSEGRAYTIAVPFKLEALPSDSDGMLSPASVHFTGKLVCLFGPLGRSQVDQFAAMVIDNSIGHSIGMATAGTSNSWQWEETLRFPRSGRPVARFMWSIGHTIRPNGEILEGNPPQLAEPLPMTRDNYRTYYGNLVSRALAHLGYALE
jgi:hypothetical protein